ncbi:MAG TPA: amidohydrolase family protein [Thermoanaerobaculia bacterium]|nr:amidohydrolase family protein [Thermoanaerobaculia bacterium]
MNARTPDALLLVWLAWCGAALAQAPDLSGTWRLDAEASTIDSAAPFAGLGGNAAVPTTLYVTQANNGTIVIGSDRNTSHARTYVPGSASATPLGAGEVTVRSRWEGGALVAEGRDGDARRDVHERIERSAEDAGARLVVAITIRGEQGEASSRLVYRPLAAELPCAEWSTPCKDWSQPGPPIGFVGARLIDGRGGPAIEPATVVVEAGRIVAIGPSEEVAVPPAAGRVDLGGRAVIPGLVNAHGHVGIARGLDSGLEVYTAANLRAQLETYARYGVTTVASLGGGGPVGVRVRDEPWPGPARARLLLAGPVVVARTPEDARAQVAAVAALGADLVKIRVDDNLGRTSKMSPEVYRAVIGEAHARGLRVAAHLFYLEDAKGLLRAGADLLAHSVRDRAVDDELIALLRERGACVSPTLTRELSAFVYQDRPAFFDDPFFLRSADPEVLERLADPEHRRRVRESPEAAAYERALGVAKGNLLRLVAAGVPIAFGTDSGPPGRFQGYFEHLELELMAEAGMSPTQVLLAATRDAARCLGLDEVGTLAPGHRADFVVLDADPLEDVRNLRRIHSVWIGGRAVAANGPDGVR